MKSLARGLAGLLVWCAASPATAQPAVTSEHYVADVSEVPPEYGMSSTIELKPDGSFDWRYALGELALSARGEWQRDGGMIRLSNPDQVGDPVVELAASAHDPAVVLRVALDPASARMASVLEVEVEWPDNLYARVPLAGGEVAFAASEGQPIAVRLMSEAYSFRSQPFPVSPDGDNVLTLRLVPADLGQAFFASQQMPYDERGMTLDWRGIALRYDRAPAPAGGAD